MKLFIFVISMLITYTIPAQDTPFYEQIAFDYFQKEIYPKEKVQKKIYVSDTLANYDGPFNWPACLKSYRSTSLESINASGKNKITILQNTGLKIVKAKNRHRVNCYIVQSMDMENRNHVVNVVIVGKFQGDVHHIELDNIGNVLRYCKGGWIE